MKKAIAVLLVAVMCFAIVPAAHAEESDTYFYTYTSVTGVEPSKQSSNATEGTVILTYKNITRKNFDDYLAVLSKMRFVPFELTSLQGKSVYYIIYHCPSNTNALLQYTEETQTLYTKIDAQTTNVSRDLAVKAIEQQDAYTIHINGSAQGYVLPQFFAVAGKPTSDGQTAMYSIFDGQMCWAEDYSNVSPETIDLYLHLMYLFGCDIKGGSLAYDSTETYYKTIIYHLTQNYETLVILTYNTDTGAVSIYYNPAASKPYDLKSASDLNKMIEPKGSK